MITLIMHQLYHWDLTSCQECCGYFSDADPDPVVIWGYYLFNYLSDELSYSTVELYPDEISGLGGHDNLNHTI